VFIFKEKTILRANVIWYIFNKKIINNKKNKKSLTDNVDMQIVAENENEILYIDRKNPLAQ